MLALLVAVACARITGEAMAHMTQKLLEEFRQLKSKERQLQELHDNMLATVNRNPSKSADPRRDPVELLAVKRLNLEEALNTIRARLLELTPALEEFIGSVSQEDPVAGAIIALRFGAALSWKATAERVHGTADSCRMCSLRYLQRKGIK